MIELTKAGIKFEDPTKEYLIFGKGGMVTMFEPASQLEEAVVFLKDNQKDITFAFLGEAGEYMRLPEPGARSGRRWIGFACTTTNSFDVEGKDLLQLMQNIPEGSHTFYVYRT